MTAINPKKTGISYQESLSKELLDESKKNATPKEYSIVNGETHTKEKKKLGIITIGQSPRLDITRDLIPMLSDDFSIIEKGALDDFTYEQVMQNFAPSDEDLVLVSRMRDGRQAKFAEKYIIDLVQKAIEDVEEQGCEVVALMCTGEFPELKTKSILLRPQEIVYDLLKCIAKDKKLGIVAPDESQIDQTYETWRGVAKELSIVSASPYLDNVAFEESVDNLLQENVDLIYLNCMGYSAAMKKAVENLTGKSIILPRTLIARIIKELA